MISPSFQISLVLGGGEEDMGLLMVVFEGHVYWELNSEPGPVSCISFCNLYNKPLDRYPGCPYFIDKENEPQSSYVTPPRSHSQ